MNKKGFTLIELLAVILILGIIALIAIPTVNNILKESRQGAFNASMQNIIKAAEEKCLTEHMKGNTVRQFIFSNGKVSPSLDVKGDLPKSGIINLNENCEATATLSDGDRKYVLTYEGSSVEECTSNSCSFASNLKESDEKYQCFNFDEETGTILKYNGHNPSCKGDVYIPAMINDVPVVKINAIAFSNPDKVKCYIGEELTEYPGTYIPKEEDGYCYGTSSGYGIAYSNNFSFNILNMSDAGYLIEVDDDAFYGTGITEIFFNDNLERIGDSTFANLNTKKIVLPKNLNQLDESAFEYSNIEELVINDKLKVIGEYAFEGNLFKEINIPEGVEYIEEGSFGYTEDYENEVVVKLPNSLIGIGNYAFASSNTKKVTFGKNLEYLGVSAFFENMIEEVTILDNLKEVGDYAFQNNKIKKLNLGKNIEKIGEYAFTNNLIDKLEIPSTIKDLGEGAFTGNKLTENIFIYDRNSDGTENKKVLNSYAGASTVVVIPDGVEELRRGALFASPLTSITFNEGLKKIGGFLYNSNNLTSLTIPSSVETIDEYAFTKSNARGKSLNLIINKTGKSFEWGSITNSSNKNQVFETGTISHDNGAIQVTK